MNSRIFEKIFDLKDKVAVITGGSSGIGFSIAQTLGHLGVKVAVVNRTKAAGEEAAVKPCDEGAYAKAFQADC